MSLRRWTHLTPYHYRSPLDRGRAEPSLALPTSSRFILTSFLGTAACWWARLRTTASPFGYAIWQRSTNDFEGNASRINDETLALLIRPSRPQSGAKGAEEPTSATDLGGRLAAA